MNARFRARWGRRAAGAALAAVVAVGLGACETDPATDVFATSATLNAKGKCFKGMTGWSRFQLRNVTLGGAFEGVGERYVYDCGADTGLVQFSPTTVTGLWPGHRYQFRLRTELSKLNGRPSNEQFWTDATGTRGGTNYDAFTTGELASENDMSNQPPEQNGCDLGVTSCASAPRKCKRDLKNRHDRWDRGRPLDRGDDKRLYWVVTGRTGNPVNFITSRHTDIDAGLTLTGTVMLWFVGARDLIYSQCDYWHFN
jgi:hypothetical protein